MPRKIAKKVAPKVKAAAALSRQREGKAKKKRHDGERENPIARGRAYLAEPDTTLSTLSLAGSTVPNAPDTGPASDDVFALYPDHPAHHEDTNETGQYGAMSAGQSNLARTMEGYYDRYGEGRNCGDMIAHILTFRTLEETEQFVYDMTGKAWPALNPGHRRMNAGNVIRGLVNRYDRETLDWLLSTPPK